MHTFINQANANIMENVKSINIYKFVTFGLPPPPPENTRTRAHTNACMHAHMHTRMHMQTHMHAHAHTHARMHTCMHACMHMHAHTHTHTHTHLSLSCMFAHIDAFMGDGCYLHDCCHKDFLSRKDQTQTAC